MQSLIGDLARFIVTGEKVRPSRIWGPWPDHYCGGDLWGYGEAMEQVRTAGALLGVLASTEPPSEQENDDR